MSRTCDTSLRAEAALASLALLSFNEWIEVACARPQPSRMTTTAAIHGLLRAINIPAECNDRST